MDETTPHDPNRPERHKPSERLEHLESMLREFGRTWSAERENIYEAINKLGGEMRTSIGTIMDRLSAQGKPNWFVVGLGMTMLSLACGVGLFVLRTSMDPMKISIDHLVELNRLERDRLQTVSDMAVRNDERWTLWLGGHLVQQRPADVPPVR